MPFRKAAEQTSSRIANGENAVEARIVI